MRLSKWAMILAFAVSVFAAPEKYVQPTKEGTDVYKNEIREVYEEPIFTVGTQDRLQILETKARHYKIKSANGQIGWVEKRLVVTVGKSKTFVFDNAEVIGYLDNPTPVYIIDTDDPNADPINLDRSFKDALRENVDKETVERQVK
ncbi:MAG TPA: hypothetical protein PLE24_03350 [Chitinispirillaceae bacterium]|nr:hypothetical protein [Chitinispirillaceae bacterium]